MRYTGDVANLTEPFCGGFNLWPCAERDHNQFATIEEKHIFSANVINTAHFGYSRPLETLSSINSYPQYQFYPPSANLVDVTITASPISLGGAYAVDPIRLMQNKFATGDDVLWTKGAHNLTIGASITRIQDGTKQQFPGGGTWTFNSPALFLQGNSFQFSGPLPGNSVQLYNADGTKAPITVPGFYGQRDFREFQYVGYIQDDWKVRSNLTLNLGLRYEPTSNPYDPVGSFPNGIITTVEDTPFGPGQVSCSTPNVGNCSALGTVESPGFTRKYNVYAPIIHLFAT